MASTAAHLDDAESISCHCSSANNNLAEGRISLTLRPAASLPGKLLVCPKQGFVAAFAATDRSAVDCAGEV
jgi:hypothetical protein